MKLQKSFIQRNMQTLLLLVLVGSAFAANALPPAPWVGKDLNGVVCRGGVPGSGPYNYLNRRYLAKELKRVERRHFTPRVERLIRGESTKDVKSDLAYTLRQWPNHHRALNAVIEYQILNPKAHIGRRSVPAECYLQRAVAYSPDDSTSAMLYALFLHKTGHKEQALKQYRSAESIAPNNRQIQYNLALLLVEMKKYDEAKSYAKKLYVDDFPLRGLKRKLSAAGHWSQADEEQK